MTGNPLAAELQRERDVQVAAAVSAAIEAAAHALETAAWADEGPYARNAAALVRSFAPRTVDSDAQMPARPAVSNAGASNSAVGSAPYPPQL